MTSTSPCECGCGQLARRRFLRGHNHRSPEARARVAARSAARIGERNPSWKGERAGYVAVHTWLARHFPKTGVCDECGDHRKTDYALLDHSKPHTRNRDDYAELCRPCHQRSDYRWRVAAQAA